MSQALSHSNQDMENDFDDLVKLQIQSTEDQVKKEEMNTGLPASTDADEVDFEDENDPIVHRIPVFLSQELANELYLVQYPLRPADRPYTDVGPMVSAQLKPKQRCLDMEFSINNQGMHYDTNADFDMPVLKLSSLPVPPKTNFAAGVYCGEQIVLTPLHATVRMFPSLQHIDDAVEEEHAEAERRKNGGVAPTPDVDGEDMVPVMLKFKRQGAPDNMSTRRITHSYLRVLKDSEPWVPLAIEEAGSASEELVRSRLCTAPQYSVSFPLSGSNYLAYINNHDEMFGDYDVPIELQADAVPLLERVSHLLLSAKVVSFSQICRKFNIKTTDDIQQSLVLLSKKSYLIHGNFVCKSELIYNLQRFRGHFKTVLCRNMVIAFFAQSFTVNRKEIANVVNVDDTTLTEILEELGEQIGETENWNFKLPVDQQFIQHFPEYHASQGDKYSKLYDHTLHLLNPLKPSS